MYLHSLFLIPYLHIRKFFCRVGPCLYQTSPDFDMSPYLLKELFIFGLAIVLFFLIFCIMVTLKKVYMQTLFLTSFKTDQDTKFNLRKSSQQLEFSSPKKLVYPSY